MIQKSIRKVTVSLLASVLASTVAYSEDWLRFRGPNGTGVAGTQDLPLDLSPDRARWQREVPFGRSSPIVVEGLVIVTGATGSELLTSAFDAASGEPRWQSSVPRLREDQVFSMAGPGMATPVSDGDSVFTFFPAFGLVAYDLEGKELWRAELPPFDNFYGLASSPVLEGDVLVLQCDQQRKPFLIALNKSNGELLWRKERVIGESWATPVILHPGSDSAAVLALGTRSIDAYAVRTGELLYTVPELGYAPVASPALDGNRVYVTAPDGSSDAPIPTPETMFSHDADGNGTLSEEELNAVGLGTSLGWLDRDGDGTVTRAEYTETEALWTMKDFGIVAVDLARPEGEQIVWRERRAVPYIATPILHKGVLFAVKDGGILTSFDAETGEVLKRGRIEGAAESFHPSPIVADDRLYLTSSGGTVAVVSAVGEWELLQISDLDEPVYASPAVVDGQIFVRTRTKLMSFAKQ